MPEENVQLEDQLLDGEPSFEERMKKRVNRDFGLACDFLSDVRREWLDRFQQYHNAQRYEELRQKNQFPVSFMQDQVDTFVASMMHPIWAKDQPCKLVPGPKTPSENAEAKQKLHEYQNREDQLKLTTRKLIHDLGLYGICVAKTDYVERSERQWVPIDVPVTEKANQVDELGNVVGEVDVPVTVDGVPVMRKVMQIQDVVTYKGPHTERIDPMDVFFTQDKTREPDDRNPVMIRRFVDKRAYEDKDIYINQDMLESLGEGRHTRDDESHENQEKRRVLKMKIDEAKSRKVLMGVEWQGWVDKRELYEYLGEEFVEDPVTGEIIDKHDLGLVKDGERALCICEVVDSEVVVRLDEFPFDFDHSNLVLGLMRPQENEMIGGSVGADTLAEAKHLDKLAGIFYKALKVSVSRGHIINTQALDGDPPDVNSDDFVLKVQTDPRMAHAILDQPDVSAAVVSAIGLTTQWGKNRSGIQDVSSGRADAEAETLGENELIATKASIRQSDPLEIIEDTLIIPMTRMRDEINQQYIDEEYLVEVIGEENARAWEAITPDQIKSHTRFMCESSGRELSRAVKTQQLLTLNQIAPNIISAGQTVRLDRALYRVQVDGFGDSAEEAGYILPLVKEEQKSGDEETMDRLMAQNAQMMEMLKAIQLQTQMAVASAFPLGVPTGDSGGAPGGQTTPPGQELPQPTTEADAIESAMASSQPEVSQF